MAKYAPLQDYLQRQPGAEVPVRFDDIERVIGAPLPPVARKHRAWWSNNPRNSVMTKAWLAAGFKAERVDMGAEKLVFRRTEPRVSQKSQGDPLAAIYGALQGTVRFNGDPTAPTGEAWDAEVGE